MTRIFMRFKSDQSGATSIEYALIAAGIGLVIVVGIDAVGAALNGFFQTDIAGAF